MPGTDREDRKLHDMRAVLEREGSDSILDALGGLNEIPKEAGGD